MKNILIFGLFFCLCGCLAPATNINKVSLGMTKRQVLEIMGVPTSTSTVMGKEYLNYTLAEGCRDPMCQHCKSTPYHIKLIDGKVDDYGRHGDFITTSSTPPIRTVRLQTTEIP